MIGPSHHVQTIFHLVPQNPKAESVLAHPDNQQFVSSSAPPSGRNDLEGGERGGPRPGLEIGYHVRRSPDPEIIVEVGRNADLILPATTISAIQFSFEVHPKSKAIVFHDRSRYHNTIIEPFGFRSDRSVRQLVLEPGISYDIAAGSERKDLYRFKVWWVNAEQAPGKVNEGYRTAKMRALNNRSARTVDEDEAEIPSSCNKKLQTLADAGVQRVTQGELLGRGSFGEVRKAVDLDSGRYVAVKRIVLTRYSAKRNKLSIDRKITTLSSLCHKNIVEFLGSSRSEAGTLCVYMSLKAGNLNRLLNLHPYLRSNYNFLSTLLQDMLEALDYLAHSKLCHGNVKPQNILYTLLDNDRCTFQLTDFGFSGRRDMNQAYYGFPLYTAPEMVDLMYCGLSYDIHTQSPKADVWSLFVTIVSILPGSELPALTAQRHIIEAIKKEAIKHPRLSPMARENPTFRASAAQMLVEGFDGKGLTTPRREVEPIPDVEDSPRKDAPRKLGYSSEAPTRKSAFGNTRRVKKTVTFA